MTVSVQYRIVVGKKDERVEGPDDADVVITVPLADGAGRRVRSGRRVHAGPAEVDGLDGRAVPPAAHAARRRARSAALASRP